MAAAAAKFRCVCFCLSRKHNRPSCCSVTGWAVRGKVPQFRRPALGGTRVCGRLSAASRQRYFGLEKRVARQADGCDAGGRERSESAAAGEGCPAVLDQLQKWNDGIATSTCWPARSEPRRHVGTFLWCRDDTGGQRAIAGWPLDYIHRSADQGGHRVQPQRPPRRAIPTKAFGDVKIPWMLMTGTQGRVSHRRHRCAVRLERLPGIASRTESMSWSSTVPNTRPSPTAHYRVIEQRATRITIVSYSPSARPFGMRIFATTRRPRRGSTATAQARCSNRPTAGSTSSLVEWRHPCGRH